MREWKGVIRNVCKILAVILCAGLFTEPMSALLSADFKSPVVEASSFATESIPSEYEADIQAEDTGLAGDEADIQAEDAGLVGDEADIQAEDTGLAGDEMDSTIDDADSSVNETASSEAENDSSIIIDDIPFADAVPSADAASPEIMASSLGDETDISAKAASARAAFNPVNGENQLTADSTMSSTVKISSGQEYVIDLNGHTLTMSGSSAHFEMQGGTLTILDSSPEQTGTILLSNNLVQYTSGGTFNLQGGTIDGSTQTTTPQHGGAVTMKTSNNGDGVFNMSGGVIQNCRSSQYGGAVYVGGEYSNKKSYFNMSGGIIRDCSSGDGGAIYVDGQGDMTKNGDLTISGGTITGNTASTGAAIYNNGNFYLSGYVDINGSVYFRNAWEGYYNWIHIIGPLCVLGNGYIDVDTTYWDSGYVNPWNSSYKPEKFGTGYTVVENSSGGAVDPETFYPYKEYFYNSKRNMGVTAGYASIDKAWSNTNHWMQFTDVMGIKWNVTEAVQGSPGKFQTKDFLIYAGIGSGFSEKHYYSFKMIKRDAESGAALNGAVFELYDSDHNLLETCTSGESGTGLAYFKDSSGIAKLMKTDGTYYLREVTAPEGYDVIAKELTIVIEGENVTITGGDGDYEYTIVTEANEICITAKDSKAAVPPDEPKEYTVQIEKYGQGNGLPLANAEFRVAEINGTAEGNGTTGADGKASVTKDGADFLLEQGNSYILSEVKAPANYYKIDGVAIAVGDDGSVTVAGRALAAGETVSSDGNDTRYGAWTAALDENQILTIKVYDEEVPFCTLRGFKYGTAAVTGNELAGAEFELYRYTSDSHGPVLLGTAVSSEADGEQQKGEIRFVDADGKELELAYGSRYIIREVKAPDGYQLMEGEINLLISPTGEIQITQDGQEYDSSLWFTAEKDASAGRTGTDVRMSILNEAVYTLPETGSVGIYRACIIPGTLCMCMALGVLVLLKRVKRYS